MGTCGRSVCLEAHAPSWVPRSGDALLVIVVLAAAAVLLPHAPYAVPMLALAFRRVEDTPSNATREAILAHVRGHPGSSIVEAAGTARVTHPTAKYHLDILERTGVISSQRWGNKRMYFPRGCALDAWEREVVTLLRSAEASTVLLTVVSNPWTYPKEVAEREGLSRLTVAAHARALQSLGLVHLAREGRVHSLVPDRQLLASRGLALAAKLPEEDSARILLESIARAA